MMLDTSAAIATTLKAILNEIGYCVCLHRRYICNSPYSPEKEKYIEAPMIWVCITSGSSISNIARITKPPNEKNGDKTAMKFRIFIAVDSLF